MKAKVIKTGEVVEVQQRANGSWASSNMNTTKFFDESELDFEFQKWDAFRREAAKDAMCAMINSCSTDGIFPDPDEVSGMAVLYADNLIVKLKEDGKA